MQEHIRNVYFVASCETADIGSSNDAAQESVVREDDHRYYFVDDLDCIMRFKSWRQDGCPN